MTSRNRVFFRCFPGGTRSYFGRSHPDGGTMWARSARRGAGASAPSSHVLPRIGPACDLGRGYGAQNDWTSTVFLTHLRASEPPYSARRRWSLPRIGSPSGAAPTRSHGKSRAEQADTSLIAMGGRCFDLHCAYRNLTNLRHVLLPWNILKSVVRTRHSYLHGQVCAGSGAKMWCGGAVNS